jgi:hypothetical protein
MRPASTIAVAVLTLGLAAPAPVGADGRADPFAGIDSLLDPNALFQGVVREEDLSVLFAHLRAALIASYQGREAPSTEELDRRMEAIAAEMRVRGALAGLALLTAFELAAHRALRDAAPVPVPAPR